MCLGWWVEVCKGGLTLVKQEKWSGKTIEEFYGFNVGHAVLLEAQ